MMSNSSLLLTFLLVSVCVCVHTHVFNCQKMFKKFIQDSIAPSLESLKKSTTTEKTNSITFI